MTDRPSIQDLAHAIDTLDSITKRLKAASDSERHDLFREFKKLLTVVEAMIVDLE